MRILHSRKLIFVSKPRCGSTSIRNMLTRICTEGDVICNVPDHERGLHPHMSAPAIHQHLRDQGYNPDEYKTFTVTRNPLDMLWSYYKYFEPDQNFKYNYSEDHDESLLFEFLEWLKNGRVGLGKYWRNFVPEFVNQKDLSPLSLEAHICGKDGSLDVDKWFMLEDLEPCLSWLESVLEQSLHLKTANRSDDSKRPEVPESIVDSLALQFPMEFAEYNIATPSQMRFKR